jgi:hypothetical protein
MHNPKSNKYAKFVNTPAGSVRLQFAAKGRNEKFWRLVWPTKQEQVTVHYRQVRGGWGIELYLTGGPNVKPGINAITHATTSRKFLNLEEAVLASVTFLQGAFPKVAGGSFVQEATHAQSQLEKSKIAGCIDEIEEALKLSVEKKDPTPPMERKDAPWRF